MILGGINGNWAMVLANTSPYSTDTSIEKQEDDCVLEHEAEVWNENCKNQIWPKQNWQWHIFS